MDSSGARWDPVNHANFWGNFLALHRQVGLNSTTAQSPTMPHRAISHLPPTLSLIRSAPPVSPGSAPVFTQGLGSIHRSALVGAGQRSPSSTQRRMYLYRRPGSQLHSGWKTGGTKAGKGKSRELPTLCPQLNGISPRQLTSAPPYPTGPSTCTAEKRVYIALMRPKTPHTP